MVGAGPGDAGLLTLRGAELLRLAEVVICDVLVNPELPTLPPKAVLPTVAPKPVAPVKP